MIGLSLVTAVILVCVSMILEGSAATANVWFDFFGWTGQQMLAGWNWSLLGIGLMWMAARLMSKNAKSATVYAFQAGLLAMLLSGLMVFGIAVLELNILAMLYNSGLSLGVVKDPQAITERLKKTDQLPMIKVDLGQGAAMLTAIGQVSAGNRSYFAKNIIPSIPAWLVWPINTPGRGIILVDDTLIVSKINGKELEEMGPQMGRLMVKNLFADRQIKTEPVVRMVNREEYARLRRMDFAEKIKDLDKQLFLIKSDYAVLEQKYSENEYLLISQEERMIELRKAADAEYWKCISSKTKKKEEDCEEEKRERIVAADQTERLKIETEKQRKEIKVKQTETASLIKVYEDSIKLGQALSDNLPTELGAFSPPDQIKLLLGGQESVRSIADILESLTHEYLHYASYNGVEKKFDDAFYEEGLTEYWARRATKKGLGIETNLGYPVAVKVMERIAARISDTELADVYFSKDQKGLERLIDRAFGENFYKKTRFSFGSLMYINDSKIVLPIVNPILEEMGGERLTEKDLLSNFSDYQN